MHRFDLDKALAAWRRSLAHTRAFLDDDLDELEQHLRDHVDALTRQGRSEEAAFEEALDRLGSRAVVEAEYGKVRYGRGKRRRSWRRDWGWEVHLWKHYVRSAWRGVRRHQGHAAINVLGLAVGLAACLLLLLFVRHERSYDRFFTDADRLYRVTLSQTDENGHVHRAMTQPALAPTLVRDLPEVEAAVRLDVSRRRDIRVGGVFFSDEKVAAADSTFFELFDFPFLQGDPQTGLGQPDGVVLTQAAARRYFGEADPLGRTLEVVNGARVQALTVTGVIADLPPNTHLAFDLVYNRAALVQMNPRAGDGTWWLFGTYTYLRLADGADAGALAAKLPAVAARYLAERPEAGIAFHLQPVTDIHLRSHLQSEIQPNGYDRYVRTAAPAGRGAGGGGPARPHADQLHERRGRPGRIHAELPRDVGSRGRGVLRDARGGGRLRPLAHRRR